MKTCESLPGRFYVAPGRVGEVYDLQLCSYDA